MYRLFGGSARRTDFSKRNPRLSASRRSNLEFRTYMPRTTFSPTTYMARPPGANTRETSFKAARISTI
jgi:hypothetical protein